MMPSNLEIFEHTHEGRAYVSRIARPSGKGPHPGVLVMHDGQGVGAFLCERAQRLANLGYVALATDMFGEGRQHSDPAEGSAAVIALRKDGEGLRKRVAAAFRAFSTLPDVDAGRVAAIGFCFGGQCVIELARTGAGAKAAVSFHGTLTTHDLAAPGTIGARILALTGARDPFASEVDRAAFAAEMTAAGADWHMSLYGSGKHGFTDPIADTMAQHMDGVGYSAFLDRFSWAEATAFLDLCLNGRL